MPLLGRQPEVVSILQSIVSMMITRKPIAIVIITPHWIIKDITVSLVNGIDNTLFYDYSGFPKESYSLQYPAKGSPDLATRIQDLLVTNKIPCVTDNTRGWDHGVFIPLMVMYPNHDIPVVAMSIHSSLDPEYHIRVGRALSPLINQDSTTELGDEILFIGSGASFHNFNYLFSHDTKTRKEGMIASKQWASFLHDTLTSSHINNDERIEKMIRWQAAPGERRPLLMPS
jgi:aromatic ring-opening dioxygenase catalytic subunit (LigB family)